MTVELDPRVTMMPLGADRVSYVRHRTAPLAVDVPLMGPLMHGDQS